MTPEEKAAWDKMVAKITQSFKIHVPLGGTPTLTKKVKRL
jgi:hypothetical protein